MINKFAGIDLENKIIMGVLNLSAKTFYKGSFVKNAEEATNRAETMVRDGAEMIDLGAMSTGPQVKPVSADKEKKTLLPILEAVRGKIDVPISIDTQRAEIAEESLNRGADIINDVSGLKADQDMPRIVSNYDCSVIIMANRISGRIRTAEKESGDIENITDVRKGLKESLQICEDYGIKRNKIAIDPSIGFGRKREQDLKVIAELDDLLELKLPICIGISRKSFLDKILDLDTPSDRLPASLGATAVAITKGADIIRTHDPKETAQFVRTIETIQQNEEK
ncbi:hypothetical protein AKJ57_01570 [candidate division MSBL1 archaeon SCGC-AAA259A05]|uniref:dihydropteroate synthase n=1 Tax=candidate division MSBL1 archaeon SCGC-AAA259A05 TaxID=1698259 RepID=A0A133UB06_9EURY|nr:hypothetical protein AKJ57_01570 [candidate division MSBL1 archaeon SCGC-AAA259A05]